MPHIQVPGGIPGIRGLMATRPETAEPLNALADALLHAPSDLSPGERELIATFVSAGNDCTYCQTIHGAVAAHHLKDEALVASVKADFANADISPKMKALLVIADNVRQGGKHVTEGDVARAKECGATEIAIHDTVLIAAAFCMYNRYVDGLRAILPEDPNFYRDRAARIAGDGYLGVNGDLSKR